MATTVEIDATRPTLNIAPFASLLIAFANGIRIKNAQQIPWIITKRVLP
nr:hypothetical protein [uncultured Clostridium sp.]